MEFVPKKINVIISIIVIGLSFAVMMSEASDQLTQATCVMASLGYSDRNVSGVINLTQPAGGNTTVVGYLTGFVKSGKLGFHVHQTGDLSGNCTAAGDHYNPFNKTHGAPNDTNRHVGDLGNIDVDNNHVANFTIVDNIITLQGNYSIVGKALVVHNMTDDLGKGGVAVSNTTGNAGARLGCCVITSVQVPTVTTVGPTGAASFIHPTISVFLFSVLLFQFLSKIISKGVSI